MKHHGVQPVAAGAIPSLDGLRAIAVSLVFFAHSGLEAIVPGGLGVTIFFILSGYLITTLMRVEHHHNGDINFRNFYVRRFLRLMPPLVIVVAIAAVLGQLEIIDGKFTPAGLLSALFYFGNYHVIAHDFHGLPAGIGVVWSLAIEEHYYLLYPPLAGLLLRAGNRPKAVFMLSLLCAVVLAWRYWLALHGASAARIIMATDTRVDAILIGCLMALWRNPWLDRRAAIRQNRAWLITSAALGVLAGTLLYRNELFRVTARYTLQSVAIAPLIYLAIANASRWPFRWLNARPLVYLGSISYTIYLSHHVILLGLAKHWPQLSWMSLTLIGALLSLAIAAPMRKWVEQPCARLRQRLHTSSAARSSPAALSAGLS